MASSTRSRPNGGPSARNSGVSVGFPSSAPTITSNIWRRIRIGTVALAGVGCPSNSRRYRWGRRRESWLVEGSHGKADGYQVTASKIEVFLREDAS